jgi:hypothetical protein
MLNFPHGTYDFITIPASPSFAIQTWSLACFLKCSVGSSGFQSIFTDLKSDLCANMRFFLNPDGHPRVYIVNGDQIVDLYYNYDCRDGNWHSLICTREKGQSVYIYLDNGTPSSSADKDQTITTNANLIIGSRGPGSTLYKGRFDEMRIYNTVMTPAQRTAFHNAGAGGYGSIPDTGLVAGWHFDEGAGNDVYDYSGNNHHGTKPSTLLWETGEKSFHLNPAGFTISCAYDGAWQAGGNFYYAWDTPSGWASTPALDDGAGKAYFQLPSPTDADHTLYVYFSIDTPTAFWQGGIWSCNVPKV